MTQGQSGPSADDAALRRAMLEKSYDEILDATKHQDDKIGRILTGIAFLTAAALAFANQAGIGIGTRFDLVDRRLPLLAYAIGAFVIGVVFTVSLLLGSLTTGLTLPGTKRPSRSTPGERSSLIYFYSIARVSKEDWRARWSEPPPRLRDELDEALVDETFNLAQRTNHKYTRTNEAVAVLSFTLFALGVAFVLGTCIAATKTTPVQAVVPFTWQARGALAVFVSAYVGVQILVARREQFLRVRTRGGSLGDDDRRRFREFRVYQFAAPLVAAALVLPGRDAFPRVAAAAAAVGALGVVAWAVSTRDPDSARTWRLVSLAVVTTAVVVAFLLRAEAVRLLGAACVPGALTLRNFIEHWRRSAGP